MCSKNGKDFNAMLHKDTGMPKTLLVTDEATVRRYGGGRMYFAPPLAYDALMKQIPQGKLTTVGEIRRYLAKQNGADFTEPLTAGTFVCIAAWASFQREEDKTPYWRTLKADGELNARYPGGIEAQKAQLESEGHTVLCKGRKAPRYFVQDYASALYDWDSREGSEPGREEKE